MPKNAPCGRPVRNRASISSDVGEQPHRDELGCANGKSTDGEREDREVDVSARGRRVDIDEVGIVDDGGFSHCSMLAAGPA